MFLARRALFVFFFLLLFAVPAFSQSISIVSIEATDSPATQPVVVRLNCSDPGVNVKVQVRDAFTQQVVSEQSAQCGNFTFNNLGFGTYRAVAEIDPVPPGGCNVCSDSDYFFVGLSFVTIPAPETHPLAVLFVFLSVLLLVGKKEDIK